MNNNISSIEDYAKWHAAREKNDPDMLEYIDRCFKLDVDSAVNRREESKKMWEQYENSKISDWFNVSSDTLPAINSLSFANIIDAHINIGLEQRPRVYFDPIFREDAERKIAKLVQARKLEPWFMKALLAADGDYERVINTICDTILDDWWDFARVNERFEVWLKWGYLAGFGGIMPRIVGNGDSANDIVLEVVPSINIAYDPTAKTRTGVKHLFVWRLAHARDIEEEYELKKDSLQPAVQSSVPMSAGDAAAAQKAGDQVRLVQALFRDNRRTRKGGDMVYPNGRMITFVAHQNYPFGIQVLNDEPFRYSYWLPVLMFPVPMGEMIGKPLARDIISLDKTMAYFIQQAAANQRFQNSSMVIDADSYAQQKDAKNFVGNVVLMKDFAKGKGQYIPTNPAVDAALRMVGFLKAMAQDNGRIHDVAQGKRPGDVESGKLAQTLMQSVERGVANEMKHLYSALSELFTVWGEMFLEVCGKGHGVRVGPGLRKIQKMPFAMNYVVEEFNIRVGPDTKLRGDPQTMVDAIAQFPLDKPGARLMLKFYPPEFEEEMLPVIEKYEQMASIKMQLEQAQAQLKEVAGQSQRLMKENQELKIINQAGLAKQQGDAVAQDKQHQVTMAREQTRQQGKLADTRQRQTGEMQRTIVQGLTQIELEKLRLSKQKAGATSK